MFRIEKTKFDSNRAREEIQAEQRAQTERNAEFLSKQREKQASDKQIADEKQKAEAEASRVALVAAQEQQRATAAKDSFRAKVSLPDAQAVKRDQEKQQKEQAKKLQEEEAAKKKQEEEKAKALEEKKKKDEAAKARADKFLKFVLG